MTGGFHGKAALLLAALMTALVLSGCGAIDRDDVQGEVSKAASTASEGMLVAREAKRQRTWDSFVVIRTAELHGAAEKIEKKLTQPTEDGLASSADQASKLAGQVRAVLGSLHEHPNDSRVAAGAESRLRRLAAQLTQIEDRL